LRVAWPSPSNGGPLRNPEAGDRAGDRNSYPRKLSFSCDQSVSHPGLRPGKRFWKQLRQPSAKIRKCRDSVRARIWPDGICAAIPAPDFCGAIMIRGIQHSVGNPVQLSHRECFHRRQIVGIRSTRQAETTKPCSRVHSDFSVFVRRDPAHPRLALKKQNSRAVGTGFRSRCGGDSAVDRLALEEFGDGFGAGADLKFFVDAADIGMDGFVADAEFIGDFLVEKTVAEAIEDFLFPGRKRFGGAG
jgi:hypothetical protein